MWDQKTTVGLLPRRAAAQFGDRIALQYEQRHWTFSELDADIDRVAKALIALGVKPGDKCMVWLNNQPEWIHLLFAIAKVGAVQVPVNTRFRADDLDYVLRQSDSEFLFTHDTSGPIDYLSMVRELVSTEETNRLGFVSSERFPALEHLVLVTTAHHDNALNWEQFLDAGQVVEDDELTERAAAVCLDDTLFIMYTSGTTGFPKGVMRNHHLLRNQVDRLQVLETTADDVVINYLPLFHIFGYVDGPLSSIMTGNKQVLMNQFDAEQALTLVEQEGGTQVQGFEAHLNDLVIAQQKLAVDVSTLRCGVFAAGMQSAVEITRTAHEVLAPLRTISAYGMTEIGANCALSNLGSTLEQAAETSGKPAPGFEFRIVNPATGKDLPTGEPGELWVKTYNLMQGYYRKPEQTTAALTDDGWFRTGDMGLLREDGYFRFVGRYKDMLKIGGENVDPMEVERHLLQIEGVREAAVVGYPDKRLNEVAVAFVRRASDTSVQASEVIDSFTGRIASFKIPRHVIFVDELPMTSSGKIRKVELRERALEVLGKP